MAKSSLGDLISKTAPVLGTALGGPLGGAVVSILAEIFNTAPTHESVEEAIKSSDPNVIAANLARAEAAFRAAAEESVTLRQQITSHVEMMRLDYDRGGFYSMWRPAAGWIATLYAGGTCFLSMWLVLVARDYTLLNMAPQVLMMGGPIMAIAGIYALGKSQERAALANAAPGLGDVVRDIVGRVRR